MKYWILGYFDGDGSIFISKRGNYIVSLIGNKKTLNFINNWVITNCYKALKVNKVRNIYEMRLGELDSYCFLAKLYDKEISNICLERKYSKFLKFKKKIEIRFKSLISIYI